MLTQNICINPCTHKDKYVGHSVQFFITCQIWLWYTVTNHHWICQNWESEFFLCNLKEQKWGASYFQNAFTWWCLACVTKIVCHLRQMYLCPQLIISCRSASRLQAYIAELLFHQSSTQHIDWAVSGQWQCSHCWQLLAADNNGNLHCHCPVTVVTLPCRTRRWLME